MSEYTSNDYESRPARSNAGQGLVFGGILILIGVVLLFENVTGWRLNNWWALFILIPAYSSFSTAFEAYRADGRWSRAARGKLAGGAIFTLVAFAFLFNIGFSVLWPLALIAGGVSLLINATLPD